MYGGLIMSKLFKGIITLVTALAVLGGIWMVISKVLGEEDYDEEYDDYYMEDDEEELPKGRKRRGYFSLDLNKAKAE